MKAPRIIRRTYMRMMKNAFFLIVLINSIALIGIIGTQTYWIKDAYNILDNHFSSRVTLALKETVNHLVLDELSKNQQDPETDSAQRLLYLPVIEDIKPGLIESKLKAEFENIQAGMDFKYAVIDLKNGLPVTGNYTNQQREILESGHRIVMKGFRNPDQYALAVWFPGQVKIIMKRLLDWIAISVLFAMVLIIGFPVSLYIFNNQKRLSDMKSDFINNMTHEFKTPIATISLASEMLMKKTIREDSEKSLRYAKIIFDENLRLQNHVEQILSVSLLERGKFRLKKRVVDVNDLIREAVENFGITIREREGEIKTHYCAKDFIINADREHLMNVIINLLDNANKYSPDKPWIRIGTQSTENGIIISVEDRGAGISLEDQKQIFKKLYRVPTGNLYIQKGFGIGLYYVKTIIEAHGGHINLKSELNKGSRFDVFLPFDYKPSNEDGYNQT